MLSLITNTYTSDVQISALSPLVVNSALILGLQHHRASQAVQW